MIGFGSIPPFSLAVMTIVARSNSGIVGQRRIDDAYTTAQPHRTRATDNVSVLVFNGGSGHVLSIDDVAVTDRRQNEYIQSHQHDKSAEYNPFSNSTHGNHLLSSRIADEVEPTPQSTGQARPVDAMRANQM
jgi:hypothetical protein